MNIYRQIGGKVIQLVMANFLLLKEQEKSLENLLTTLDIPIGGSDQDIN